METFDPRKVRFDQVVGEIVGPIIVAGARLYGYPVAAEVFIVAPVSTEVDDEVVLGRDGFDEPKKSLLDGLFIGLAVFDEGDVCWFYMVASSHQLDEGFYVANGIVEFGAMEIVVDGDGQQVVGASGRSGIAALSVFADEIAIKHVVLGCLGR